MEYLTLGKIVKTFGLKGEAKILSSTHFSYDRYQKNNRVYLWNEKTGERLEVIVKAFRKEGLFDYVLFKEISSIEALTPHINDLVQVEKDLSFLEENEYFYSDLLDSEVYDEDILLGKVKKIEEYASYATLRVERKNQKDILIPFVKAFIKKVDIQTKKIWIHHWEGLE